VVLGESRVRERDQRVAELLDVGFGAWTFWRTGQPVASLAPVAGDPPNLRDEACGKKRGGPAFVQATEDEDAIAGAAQNATMSGLIKLSADERKQLFSEAPPLVPVPVFLGPKPGVAIAVRGPAPILARTASGPLDLDSVKGSAFAPVQGAAPAGLRLRASVPLPRPRPARH
jgi:D-alanyl-D-alanine carboxypeptidase